MNKEIAVYDNTVSARTYLSYIAEQAGGIAVIGRDGKLYIKTIGESSVTLPLKLFKTFKWGEKYKITRVRYDDGIQLFEKGDTTGNTVYISQDNMYVVDQEQIDNIYNALKGLEFYSFEGECIIDPALDTGDIVVIDGKNVIYQGSMQFSGRWIANIQSKIQCKAKEETTTRTPSQKTINRRVESNINQIDGKITQLTKETTENSQKITKTEQNVNGLTTKVSSVEKSVENITNTEGEATGKSIHLEDSSDEPLVSIKVKGETNQATRSGKNFLKLNDTQTVNGVTATNNGNGTLTLNGTASKATTLYIANGTTQFVDGKTIAAGTSLTQSLNVISGTSSDNVTIRTLVKIGNSTNYLLLEGEKTYTPTEDIILRPCQLSIKNGTIFNNWTIFPQLEIGESVTTPEQYGASPSPDYPAKIENVEGTYTASTIPEYVPYNSLAVKVTGKNRLNINNPSSNNMATIASDNDIVTVSSTATNTTPSVIYVFNNPKINDVYRINSIILDNNGQIVIQTNNGNGWITASIKNYSDGISVSNIVYTVQEGITAIRYLLYSDKAIPSSNSSSRYKNTIVTINDEDMTYEPYKEQTVYFPLAEGQKLYKDSYLASDGIHHKRTQVVLRGNEDWVLTSTSNQIITKRFSYKISPPIMKMNSQENALCSHFANVNDATEDIEGIYYAALDGITYIALRLNVNKATTLEQFKAYLSEQYSNGTPVTVEYELSEEEIVPYTAEQQEAWDKIEQLHTYKNVTNIFSDAELDIVYARDNGLSDMYETKQNAERNYTKTTEKLVEQKMTTDNIQQNVSKTETIVANNYKELKTKFDDYAPKSDVVTLQNSVEKIQTDTYTKTEINTKLIDGSVEKVSTTAGTFDENGLTIEKTNAKTKGNFNEKGMSVIDNTGSKGETLLFAGYDEELNETIVKSKNMTVEKYLVVGANSRFENYNNTTLNATGTGVFII